jgi:hypothetical protein
VAGANLGAGALRLRISSLETACHGYPSKPSTKLENLFPVPSPLIPRAQGFLLLPVPFYLPRSRGTVALVSLRCVLS